MIDEDANGSVARRIRSGDVELAVVEAGDPAAPTVVLVHGYPDTKEVWSGVARRLAPRFHVVTYDVRGAGSSSAPRRRRGPAGYDLDRLVDDLVAVMDATSPGTPVHVVGHDWGSTQAWEAVTRADLEGRIASFTSISGPSLDHLGHWLRPRLQAPSLRHLRAVAGQSVRSWYVWALAVPGLPQLAWRTVLGRRWPELLTALEGVAPADGHPAATVATDGARGVSLYRRNVPRRLVRPRPDPHATAPVQLIVPTADAFLSPRLYDDLARWVPTLRRRTIAAGHWAQRTERDLVARWIGEFVTDVEQGTPLGSRPPAADEQRPFAGRLALVTGAGSGIGRATALAFGAAGAEVIAVDRDGDTAGQTAELAASLGQRVHPVVADVSDPAAIDDLAKRVMAEHGVVDVLVNNAGVGIAGPFLDSTVDDWQRTLDVNLWGVINGCRAFGRQMVERGEGGHIVNVASAAAYQPSKVLPVYSTTKAATLMLTECLRAELAASGIGVTAICPGVVRTNITRTTHFVGRSPADEAHMQERTTRLYQRRNFSPERVATEIVKAVVADKALVPVTIEAKLAYAMARVAPGALRALAKVDLGP